MRCPTTSSLPRWQISNNLFRGLAPNNMPAHMQYDPEEDEPVLEVSWPHLQYVYEFLLRFVVSNETDPKVCLRAPRRPDGRPRGSRPQIVGYPPT